MDIALVKDFLKVDFDEDDTVITMLLSAARKYLKAAIGVSELNEEDERVKLALLTLISDWYEHREYMGESSSPKVRYTIRSVVLQLQCEQEANDE